MTNCKNCPYTDEYCASGDCNKIQAKDVACNKISLTKQWKKRKLLEGDYYVLHISWCEVIDKFYYDGDMFFSGDVPIESKEIKEVLSPVPSYKEWKEIVESEAKSHLQADSYYNKILDLKDLLKECRRDLIMAEEDCGWDRSELIQQIDEVLK